MKALITLLFITCSMVAFGQDIDSLKLTQAQAQLIIEIDNELKELQPARVRIQSLEESKNKLIQSALMWSNIKAKEAAYRDGVILYRKEEKK